MRTRKLRDDVIVWLSGTARTEPGLSSIALTFTQRPEKRANRWNTTALPCSDSAAKTVIANLPRASLRREILGRTLATAVALVSPLNRASYAVCFAGRVVNVNSPPVVVVAVPSGVIVAAPHCWAN